MSRPDRSLLAGLLLAALAAPGCRDPESARGGVRTPGAASSAGGVSSEAAAAREGPPGAVWEVVDALREGLAAERSPADGGGRAWLESPDEGPPRARVGEPGRFSLVYEVGPLGIASGGWVQLQVSPFWRWSTPQVELEDLPGYTTVAPSAEDIEIQARTLDDQLLGIEITGRALVAGEQLRIVYGAGPAKASVDDFAESDSRFWFAVDGDGDGTRIFLPDSPGVVVLPGDPAQLRATLPSVAHPGERVRLTLAVLDGLGNAGVPLEGTLELGDPPAGLEHPRQVRLAAGDAGRAALELVAREPGVYRLTVRGPDGLETESNPMLVSEGAARVLWGDLHGHSSLSDGTGTPDDYFRYARDVASLDVVALTDHDHWGVLQLDRHPEMWSQIRDAVRRYHEPGRFVTLLGYEWTSWIHGHRHVLYFSDDGPVLSSIDPDYESPTQLWEGLVGHPALTFAHHSAGGPIRTNWEIAPDPRFEPVTEIVSVHGSSEALDSPNPIYDPVPGNFVRDALDRGYQLGFVGSGDSHDGHPGLAQLASPSGGLVGIIADEATRESVLAALRARRVYATNGPRILLRTALGAHPMGAVIPLPESGSVTEELFVRVLSPSPMERLDLVRSGGLVDSLDLEGRLDVTLQRLVEELEPGEYLYVRAVLEDGGAAWSSPIFVERRPGS